MQHGDIADRRIDVALASIAMAALCMFSSAAHAQRSRAMATECASAHPDSAEARRRAEEFVKQRLNAFVPVTRNPALQMNSLREQAEQTQLAFYGINATCARFRAGEMTREEADLSLSGFENTIANFLHDVGNETAVTAARGQVSDMATIRTALSDIGATGRQAALLGDDVLAEQSRKAMVDALVRFSTSFVGEACYQQVFDPRIAMSLQRQNDLLGTGIDVTPCANREFTGNAEKSGMTWNVRHCGFGAGEWQIKITGLFAGGGAGVIDDQTYAGDWSIIQATAGVSMEYSGDLQLKLRTVDAAEGLQEPESLSIVATDATVTDEDGVTHRPVNIPGLLVAVKKSDKPCRAGEER